MLPLFCVLFLIGWWHRERRVGALVWGILGACLGQVHSSGFLFAAAVLGATLFADRLRPYWRYWLAGSALGTVPMAQWLLYLLQHRDPVHDNFFAPHRWIEGKFWSHWVTESMGLGLGGIFGPEYSGFLRWPLIGGHPTYGAAALQTLAGLLGAAAISAGVVRWLRHRRARTPGQRLSSTSLILRASFVCYGLLLTLAAVRFYRHYLLITFPLMAVWLAQCGAAGGHSGAQADSRAGAAVRAVCRERALLSDYALVSARPGGRIAIHFGRSYEAQVRMTGQRPPPCPLPPEAGDDGGPGDLR